MVNDRDTCSKRIGKVSIPIMKKLFLLPILFLFIISFVSAIVYEYDFNTDPTAETGWTCTNGTGQAYEYNPTGDYIEITSDRNYESGAYCGWLNSDIDDLTDEWTLDFWIEYNSGGDTGSIAVVGVTDDGSAGFPGVNRIGTYVGSYDGAGATWGFVGTSSSWHQTSDFGTWSTGVKRRAFIQYFGNNTYKFNVSGSNGVGLLGEEYLEVNTVSTLNIFGATDIDGGSPNSITAKWYNMTITDSSIPASTPAGSPNINLTNPLDNTVNNSLSIDFSYLPWESGGIMQSCSLLFNNTVETTDNFILNDTEQQFPNIVVTEGTYLWSVNCTDNNTNNTYSANRTLIIDITEPYIFKSFDNNMVLWNSNISETINFSDDTLYRATVIVNDDIVLNETSIAGNTYDFDFFYNITSLLVGRNNISIESADGHTAKYLQNDYKVKNGLFNDYLEFEVYNGNKIRIDSTDGSILDTFSAKRKFDRYTFDYEPNTKKSKYTFLVTSEINPIKIVEYPHTKWGSWLVIGDHWLDFFMENEPNIKQKVKYKVIDSHTVEVDVSQMDGKSKLSFDSIGDLNINGINTTIFRLEENITFNKESIENKEEWFFIQINNTLGNTVLAHLLYNGTTYSMNGVEFGNFSLFSISLNSSYIDNNYTSIPIQFEITINGVDFYLNDTQDLYNDQLSYYVYNDAGQLTEDFYFHSDLSNEFYYSNPFVFDKNQMSFNPDAEIITFKDISDNEIILAQGVEVFYNQSRINLTFGNPFFHIIFGTELNVTLLNVTENTIRMNNTEEILFNMSDLALGKFTVIIDSSDDANKSQRFEFINDGINSINETICYDPELLQDYWIKTVSTMGNPIQDVLVKLYEPEPTEWYEFWKTANYCLISQTYTQPDGKSLLFVDSAKNNMIIASHDDYETAELPIGINQYQNEYSIEPRKIVLVQKGSNMSTIVFNIDNYFIDRYSDIIGSIYLKEIGQKVTWNTNYYVSQYGNVQLPTITKGQTIVYSDNLSRLAYHGEYAFKLQDGVHFNQLGNDNITLNIQYNNQSLTHVIEYIGDDRANMFNLREYTWDSKVVNPLLIIGLMLIVIILQFVIKSDNQDVGMKTFFIGCILLAVLAKFWIIGLMAVFYFLAEPLKKFMGVIE